MIAQPASTARRALIALGAGAAALLFAGLLGAVVAGHTAATDEAVLAFLARWRLAPLDHLFRWVTWAGSAWTLTAPALLGAALLARLGRRRGALLLGLGYGGAVLLNAALKLAVARDRPDVFPSLIPAPFDPAFPSGHAAQITAFVLAAALAWGPGRPIAAFGIATAGGLLIALVAVSRLYLQVHWPSDVLGGVLLATAWVLAVRAALAR